MISWVILQYQIDMITSFKNYINNSTKNKLCFKFNLYNI